MGGLRSRVDDGGLLAEDQDIAVYRAGSVCFAIGEGLYFGYEHGEKCISDRGVLRNGSYISGSFLSLSIFEKERFFRYNVGREK